MVVTAKAADATAEAVDVTAEAAIAVAAEIDATVSSRRMRAVFRETSWMW